MTKKLTPNKIWETIFDLSFFAGQDNLLETEYYDGDSRMLYGDIQSWAIDFEKKFNIDFNESECDYMIEIENFYNEKKKSILS